MVVDRDALGEVLALQDPGVQQPVDEQVVDPRDPPAHLEPEVVDGHAGDVVGGVELDLTDGVALAGGAGSDASHLGAARVRSPSTPSPGSAWRWTSPSSWVRRVRPASGASSSPRTRSRSPRSRPRIPRPGDRAQALGRAERRHRRARGRPSSLAPRGRGDRAPGGRRQRFALREVAPVLVDLARVYLDTVWPGGRRPW
jgi:hypothetical protein